MEGSPLLLCDEELMISSPSSSSPVSFGGINSGEDHITEEEEEQEQEDIKFAFQEYMRREHVYQPHLHYLNHLQSSSHLSTSRSKSVKCILLVCGRLHVSLRTTFNAVNYLDRFISMNSSLKWETWMIELLTIACISIASKFDEVIIPSFHEFQIEELEHTFKSRTIQQMEISVLKALNWRLSSVTSFSYIDLLIRHRGAYQISTQLLLHALLDLRFLKFKPCEIAASAIQCSHKASENDLMLLFTKEQREHINKCCKIMQEYDANSWMKFNHGCPPSPVTVIPMQTINIDINGFFKSSKP